MDALTIIALVAALFCVSMGAVGIVVVMTTPRIDDWPDDILGYDAFVHPHRIPPRSRCDDAVTDGDSLPVSFIQDAQGGVQAAPVVSTHRGRTNLRVVK